MHATSTASRFASNNSLPGNSDDYSPQGGGWGLDTKSTYRYNAAGQQVARVVRTMPSGQFQVKDTMAYDASGNISFYENYSWANNAWELWYGYKSLVMKNSAGQVTARISQSVKGGNWVNAYKDTTSYNSAGNMAEKVFYNWRSNAWEPTRKEIYTYGTSGNTPDGILYQKLMGGIWVNEKRLFSISWYNFNNFQKDGFFGSFQVHGYRSQTWSNNGWVNLSSDTTVYDNLGGFVSTSQYWDASANAWVNARRHLHSTDNNRNFIGSKNELWQNNAWGLDTDYQEILTYNANGDITERIYREWDQATNSYRSFQKQVYYNFTRISGIKEASLPLHVQLYPNPASDRVTIQMETPLQTTVLISDLTGRPVYKHELKPTDRQLNIASLAKGTYIIRLQNARGTYISKFLKQ
ncbi:T9SS type A sorting domain-containing protein [Adhaeribacter soli]|uniref:T9SS type A sorting domain-containing protein n=1 Tax=Adhaeribacter soli TaxID=2607655 RepID=UPI00177B4D74|nr:T9SS type A sorting domain-containing protein [Adhaeribacter soli]